MNKYQKIIHYGFMFLLFIIIFRIYFRISDFIFSHFFTLTDQGDDIYFMIVLFIYLVIILPCSLLLIRRWLHKQEL